MTTSPHQGPVLEVTDLVKHFATGSGFRGGSGVVRAVDGVSFTIGPGEILGLVGESGSGKSTVGRCVTRLIEPTSGSIKLLGTEISQLSRRRMRPLRRQVHIVFQDPYSSLNPRLTIGQIIGEPMLLHRVASGSALDRRVREMLEKCGLRADMIDRYPHELSGGQRQRVGLARALALEPALVIADEPVSALDVSVQASILNLITDLQRDLGFSCLFITHDLSVVEYISDAIAVMYLGKIVEKTSRQQLFEDPQMPYTQSLLTAAPVPDPAAQRSRTRIVLGGDIPSPLDPPPGCPFHTRCPVAVERCRVEVPPLAGVTSADHLVACHLVDRETGAPDVSAAAAAQGAVEGATVRPSG
ncbi:peptide/nickel transport system ATP-binding protein/oligopeptide transport system ATP-binding protein [Blastococcus colisei]|uniref:Peptide/nickel transport system ATP-binding protein/oligopeptide transport system ATP-binding protein n=1 Tax=Blastococcus colisei TaxID=1564162 RepID=A0A543PIG9_9ACTN|nr:oligopeptide/dipeptide ABC transporter ATP-binding protein [Blastococcus colisei]TQN43883.1 peptide/nickel transport system ATP-binding protein/oligopeptide transport system ATP-binding protein [Blastococcus colisei]